MVVKRFQEPQGSIVKKLSQISKTFNTGEIWGKDFLSALKKDVDEIEFYARLVNDGCLKTEDAYSDLAERASSEAQYFVKANQAMFESASDWFRMGERFKTQALMKQLGQSVNGSFTGAINAIRLYNSGLKTAGLTQKEFHEAIAETNPELDAYITKMEADGKKPTEWGYIWATKQAAIETALFTSAIAAGQLALNAVAKNADPQAAKITGALTSIAGGITAVVSAIAMAKGALSLTAGVGWLSVGLAALTAGIGAVNTASQRMREAWQEDIDKIEDVKQSSEELADAYVNVSKYLKALQDGEDVGSELEKRPAGLAGARPAGVNFKKSECGLFFRAVSHLLSVSRLFRCESDELHYIVRHYRSHSEVIHPAPCLFVVALVGYRPAGKERLGISCGKIGYIGACRHIERAVDEYRGVRQAL